MELEDETDFLIAECRQGFLREAENIRGIYQHGSAVGDKDSSKNLKKRGLAGAAGSDYRQDLPFLGIKTKAFENLLIPKGLGDVLAFDNHYSSFSLSS